jgi:predicted Holliday junction resolvase-like endonuclease
MNLLRVLFELFVLYMLYKLIFDFIIPIYNTTKQVKQKVNEMQRTVNEQAKQQERNQYTSATKEASPKQKNDDYIEFEEVK